jgi:hypothetical protein
LTGTRLDCPGDVVCEVCSRARHNLGEHDENVKYFEKFEIFIKFGFD